MPRKAFTQPQLDVLAAIRRANMEEKQIEMDAHIEAQRIVADRTKAARERTNALIWLAHTTHHLSQTAITEVYAGTHRLATKARLAEHAEHIGANVSDEKEAGKITAELAGIKVSPMGDTGTVVTLDNYSHPDLADDVSGTVTFDAEGDITAWTGDLTDNIESDPLFAVKLWALRDVQEAI